MDPTVVAAWIAAGASVLTLLGSLTAQYLAGRDAKKAAEEQRKQLDRSSAEQSQQLERTRAEQREHWDKTFAEQREQLNKRLAAQSDRLDRTLAEQRARTFNERFATAAGQLGSDKPPEVRLAGVHAMAGLADDWRENRQTCVDVLCAFLQLPYEPNPGQGAPEPQKIDFQRSRRVRHAVIQIVTAHLQRNASVSWQGLNFDFTGVVFDGGSFA